MVLWGLYPIFTHYFVLQLDPLFLVSVSTLISSLPFLIKIIFTKNVSQLFSKQLLKQTFPAAVFVALGNVLLFAGTKLTTGTNTGLLLQIEPIYSLLVGIIVFKEAFNTKRLFATSLMIGGAIIIIYKGFVLPNLGDIFILLTTLMYQISHAFIKKLLDKGKDMALLLGVRQFLGGLMLLLFALIVNPSASQLVTVNNLQSGTYLGLYLAVVILLWYMAVKRMPLSIASSFLPITAIFALLGASLFLKETIMPQHYVGFLLIVSGILWLAKLFSKKKN